MIRLRRIWRTTGIVTDNTTQDSSHSTIQLTIPSAADGPHLHRLVARCKPLDENSIYCNLLHCSHFAGTSVAAWMDGQMVGFVSGYLIPDQADTYFLWQVAVDDAARGRGLAKRMIRHILDRPQTRVVRYLNTTITPDNEASWALFRSLAKDLDADWQSQLHFERDTHFGGAHADEQLMRIGPFQISPSSE